MNDHYVHLVLARQITALATDGGRLSPSVYDTSLALRADPDAEAHGPAWAWLMAMQRADGGWGPAGKGRACTLPTLSALLALHAHRADRRSAESLAAGLTYLASQGDLWREALPDDLPVGSELVLPPLLAEAQRRGLPIDLEPYAGLHELGKRRRELIARHRVSAGSPAAHSFEAWGDTGDPALLDASGGVGHSPAATLTWLRLARRHGVDPAACRRAEDYLAGANAATGHSGTGLLPTVWPITRFEQIWVLYAVVTLGLLELPAVEALMTPQLRQLAAALDSDGVGMSDHFAADGDDTVTAVATLLAAGMEADMGLVERFRHGGHFVSYHHELQPSLTTTAHAIHALALVGADVAAPVATLAALQQPDGRWAGDKWHGSWLYTTSQVIVALAAAPIRPGLAAARDAVLGAQGPEGSWGGSAETAYALMALIALERAGLADDACVRAALRGADWLSGRALDSDAEYTPGWIGKELYEPYRIDATWSAAAVIAARHRYCPDLAVGA